MKADFFILKAAVPSFCFVLTLYGLLNYVSDHEKNMCNMTYMFEYPEYIKIPLRYGVVKKYPRYSLYVYGEGRYAEELRSDSLNGIPVLFIPGNAGSHKQVRSIASVSMRMGHSLRSPYHFNFFATSFKEELSGFYGSILEDEAEFVRECIHAIQNLYSKKKKVIIVGHSMGGVLARSLFSADNFDPSCISAIFTLAAPHKQPVLALDYDFLRFYEQIHNSWVMHKDSRLQHIPLISIGGGQRDVLVRSELTVIRPEERKFVYHVLTTSIPGVWVSTDHLAIVWCKQLVLTLSRIFFDLIDFETNEVSSDVTLIHNVLYHHFIQRSYDGHFSRLPPVPFIQFSHSGEWIEEMETSWRFSRSKVLTTIYIMVPVRNNDYMVVVASGVMKPDWIFGCSSKSMKNGSKICDDGVNFSNQGKIIPRKNNALERRKIHIDFSSLKLRGFTHAMLRVEATNSEVDILGESYKADERNKHVLLPSFPERLFVFSPVRIMNFLLADRAVFYNLTVSGFGRVIDTATFIFETRICRAGSVVGQGIVNVLIPWNHENIFYQIKTTLGGMTTIPIKIHNLPPKGVKPDIHMEIILDPECSYSLFVSYPMSNIISQFIKFYGLYVPSYLIALLTCMLSGQFYAIGAKGMCVSSVYILGKFPTYLSLVVLPSILYYGIWVLGRGIKFLPEPDNILIEDSGFHYILALRSVIYIIAYGGIMSMSYIFEKSIIFISWSWAYVKKNSVMQATEHPLSDAYNHFSISYFNILVCSLLQMIAVGLSGSLAITVSFLCHFGKLIKMCVRCRAEEERRGPNAATSKWRFHILLNLLWIFTTVITLPGVITWAMNIHSSFHLVNDPHTLPSVILIMSTAFIWQLPVPCYNRLFYRTTSHIIHALAGLVVLYAVKSQYRLLYFITLTFLIVNVHQVIAYLSGLKREKTE